MPSLAISMEKDTHTSKISKQKIKPFEFVSDIAGSNFTMNSH